MISLAVVVTYRSDGVVNPLIASIAQWLESDANARLVLVENSQREEMADVARQLTSGTANQSLCLVNPINTGFAPAVNFGVRMGEKIWGRAAYVILVNPDIHADPQVFRSLIDQLDQHDDVGIVSPLVCDESGIVLDPSVARRLWNRRRLFAEIVGDGRLSWILGSRPRVMPVNDPKVCPITDVDITAGAFMIMRRAVFDHGLDVTLPMYFEDQEICHRASNGGWRVVVYSIARVRHLGGHSRRSNSDMSRRLRIMELAAAPSLSLTSTTSASIIEARLVLISAGLIRCIVAGVVLATCIVSPSRRRWAISQVRLGYWVARWALRNRSLTAECEMMTESKAGGGLGHARIIG